MTADDTPGDLRWPAAHYVLVLKCFLSPKVTAGRSDHICDFLRPWICLSDARCYAFLCIDDRLSTDLCPIRKSPLSPWWPSCVETRHKGDYGTVALMGTHICASFRQVFFVFGSPLVIVNMLQVLWKVGLYCTKGITRIMLLKLRFVLTGAVVKNLIGT